MDTDSRLPLCIAVILLGMFSVSCATDVESSPDATALPVEPAAALSDMAAIGTDGLATYDESIPLTAYGKFEFFHDGLESLSEASDIVFVGRVTDYVEAVLVIPPDTEDPWGFPSVYDGIVFTVDELLAGEPADASRVTVVTFALIQNRDGSPRYRVSDTPTEIVKTGIESRNLPDGPQYLVYVSHHFDHDGPFYRPDLYFFNTSGGVVEILSDGSLGVGANPPFARVAVETDGFHSTIDHGLLLSDARAAVGIVNEDTQPSEGGPVADPLDDDFTPGGNTGGSPADDSAPTVPSPG